VPILVNAGEVESVVGVLVGGIDVDGGPTDEQRTVLDTIVTHLWHRPDLTAGAAPRLTPDAAAREITDPDLRRRVCQLLVTLVAREPAAAGRGVQYRLQPDRTPHDGGLAAHARARVLQRASAGNSVVLTAA
jgi:hypothetical protein